MTAGLLLRRLAHDGRGGFRHGDSRFLLIRPETLVGVQQAVERALGARAAECFVEGGRAGGARALSSMVGSAEERARGLTAIGRMVSARARIRVLTRRAWRCRRA